jgi:hypothetical protein
MTSALLTCLAGLAVGAILLAAWWAGPEVTQLLEDWGVS